MLAINKLVANLSEFVVLAKSNREPDWSIRLPRRGMNCLTHICCCIHPPLSSPRGYIFNLITVLRRPFGKNFYQSPTMSLPHHLQIFNEAQIASDRTLSFQPFPRLPAELRLAIWELALKKRRLIELRLESPRPDPDIPGTYGEINSLGKIVSGRDYTPTVLNGRFLHTKLLRVSRESRTVALGFYRVHFPCYLRIERPPTGQLGPRRTKSILYFNPEQDIIQLTGVRADSTFVDFIHDIKAYDPRGEGVLHLALGGNSTYNICRYLLGNKSSHNTSDHGENNNNHDQSALPRLRYRLNHHRHPKIAQDSLLSTLSNLHTLIYMANSPCGRAIIGPLENFAEVGVRFNRSLPIMPSISSFDLLPADPRDNIAEELRWVLTAQTDPRSSRHLWHEMLRTLGIPLPSPAATRDVTTGNAEGEGEGDGGTGGQGLVEQVLFAFDRGHDHSVTSIDSATDFVIDENASWQVTLRTRAVWIRPHSEVVPETEEQLRSTVRPAVGFWLFPADALGESVTGHRRPFDLTGHWPALGLARLGP